MANPYCMKTDEEEEDEKDTAKRMAGASEFDCYYSNISAKPNSSLRQMESRNPKREAKTTGTNVKGLNVVTVQRPCLKLNT